MGCLAWTLTFESGTGDPIDSEGLQVFIAIVHAFIHSFVYTLCLQLYKTCVSIPSLQSRTVESVNDDLLLQLLKVLEEAVEEVHGMLNIVSATSLTNAVHAELRVSEI